MKKDTERIIARVHDETIRKRNTVFGFGLVVGALLVFFAFEFGLLQPPSVLRAPQLESDCFTCKGHLSEEQSSLDHCQKDLVYYKVNGMMKSDLLRTVRNNCELIVDDGPVPHYYDGMGVFPIRLLNLSTQQITTAYDSYNESWSYYLACKTDGGD